MNNKPINSKGTLLLLLAMFIFSLQAKSSPLEGNSLPYPYEWASQSPSTDFTASDGWLFDQNAGAWYYFNDGESDDDFGDDTFDMSGDGAFDGTLTSQTIAVPSDGTSTLSFQYMTVNAGTLDVIRLSGTERDTLQHLTLDDEASEYQTIELSLKNQGPMQLELSFHLDASDYESYLSVKDVNLVPTGYHGGTLPYPYMWTTQSPSTDFTASQGWTFNSENNQWILNAEEELSGKLTSRTMELPDTGKATVRIRYSAPVGTHIKVETSNEQVIGDTTAVSDMNDGELRLSMTPIGQTQLSLSVEMKDGSEGSFVLKSFDVYPSGIDLQTQEIVTPSAIMVAEGSQMPVRVCFHNDSYESIVNPTFCYTALGQTVRETYQGSIAPDSVLEFTFAQPVVLNANQHTSVKVWNETNMAPADANDTLETADITAYKAFSFPFSTEFDNSEDYTYWQMVDKGNYGPTWSFGPIQEKDGSVKNILCYPFALGEYDDYAVSPGIQMPAGKSRVQFYYCGLNGGGHLELLSGTSPSIEDMKPTSFVKQSVTNQDWRSGYTLVNLEKSEIVYFAFHVTGGSDQMMIDNFNVDQNEDLAIDDVSFDTKSGFNKKTANVTVSVINEGVSPQSDVTVRYYVNDPANYEEEYIEGDIMPGDTIRHTFADPCDISTPGQTYQLYGVITKEVGPDRVNDTLRGQSLQHYANLKLPYTYNFEDSARNEQWTYQGQAAWSIPTNVYHPYSGIHNLLTENKTGNTADSWAFSECIDIPAGTYPLSFFYRTAFGWPYDDYAQSMEVKLGTQPDADHMTIDAVRLDNFLDGYAPYLRYNGSVTIPEDGSYYIGFHNVSEPGESEIQVDDISLGVHDQSLSLPYTVDFTSGDDWYHYNPSSDFLQWQIDSTAEKQGMLLNRPSEWQGFSEGMIMSPALKVTGGKKVNISVNYAFETNNTNIHLVLYTGHDNNPAAMSPVLTLPASSSMQKNTYSFTLASEDTVLYVALRSDNDYNDYYSTNTYNARIASVNVTYDTPNGIESIMSNGVNSTELFDLSGRSLQRDNVKANDHHGVYIIKETQDGKTRVRKVIR